MKTEDYKFEQFEQVFILRFHILFSSDRSSGSGSVRLSVRVSVPFMNSSLDFHVSGSDL